ncbi:MAG: hypothetical protein IJY03_07130 [Prevotella sp.]|nr:hypothetical protein [Prevotella sp.]
MEHIKAVRHIAFRLLVLLLSLLPCEVVADTLKQDGVYGKIDNLHLTYDGNRLVSVRDDAAKLLYNGAVDFNGNADGWASLRYTATGALKSDTGRGIALIEYDQWDNPRRVQFTNGNVTEYIYTATGEKLRTVHYTAMPNITVEQDTRHDLTEGEILYKDSTDYHDALIMENGRPSMYQFDGGYCSLWNKTSKVEELLFHYYTKDHLGNNREVVSEDGTVEQVTNYYPFGTPYSDHTAKGVSLQKYKYNGKELDLTHGLNTYDYGARQYYSVLLRWDRLDPLCTDYYHVSPYVYCMNNPVNSIDPDGRKIVIWYKNKQGEDRQFTFTGFHGKKYITYPRNQFVLDFLKAYMYNVRNGGGNKMREAALNNKYKIYVDDAANLEKSETMYSPGRQPTIYWEPRKGLKTTDGGKQSPATRLEHEFDHAVDQLDSPQNHRNRKDKYDEQYDSEEEKRVITGSERKTAKANKEAIRYDHYGETFDVSDPTKIH